MTPRDQKWNFFSELFFSKKNFCPYKKFLTWRHSSKASARVGRAANCGCSRSMSCTYIVDNSPGHFLFNETPVPDFPCTKHHRGGEAATNFSSRAGQGACTKNYTRIGRNWSCARGARASSTQPIPKIANFWPCVTSSCQKSRFFEVMTSHLTPKIAIFGHV